VLDYLLEEVLHQQPERVQAFLLQTSVLDRLTGPLCDALTGQGDGGATLERLQRANLFLVPLDNERRWYRYHHLFADLLRQRLLSPPSGGIAQAPRSKVEWPDGGLVSELHTRASRWYEQNGFADEAIAHALRAQDFERAARLIGEHADAVWKRGEHVKLARWLAALPPEALRAKPLLYTFAAWYLFAKGKRDPAERLLKAAEQALDAADRIPETAPLAQGQPPDADTVLRGRLAAIRALMVSWQGNAPAIIEHARQALAYLPQQDPWHGPTAIALGDAYDFRGDLPAAYQARLEAAQACQAAGDLYFFMIANLKVAITLRALGRLQQVIDLCQQQLAWAEEIGLSQTAVAGCLLAQWGEVLAERNDLNDALDRAKRGAALTEGGDLALLGFSNLCLVRVLFSVGDLAAAEKTVQKLEDVSREHDLPPLITQPTAAWRASLWLARGQLETAAQWASERQRGASQEPTVGEVALARIWLAVGALDEAIPLIQRLLEAAGAGGRTSSAIEMRVLQALAFDAHGEPTRAMAALERALALAEPGGYLRTFVDQGPPMAALLYRALSRGTAPDYVRRLLAAFPGAEQAQAEARERTPSQAELIEPLSERELEVLELIAQGLTNPEIASRLYLALNTVKAHTRSIYGKLDVHNRTEAAARARALGLLPSA
jgi:LuxR family maltose regulon positive regulatory protein